jgi:hypothetical protein
MNTLSKRMARQTETVPAVYDDDLMDILTELGIHKDFVHGRLKCAFCRDEITWENLHSLFPDSGAVKVSCSRSECVEQLIAKVEAQKIG